MTGQRVDERLWGGVRQRVLRLDPGLCDPLSEAEVADAERHLGLRLPWEYSSFLVHVGAGGAGPGGGVVPLCRADPGWRWRTGPERPVDLDRLRAPFAPWHVDGAAVDPMLLREPEYLWHPDRTAGALDLCDGGGGRRFWLVTTGDERGTVWRDHRVDGIDLAPLFDAAGRRITFGRWYLEWLSGAEALPAT